MNSHIDERELQRKIDKNFKQMEKLEQMEEEFQRAKEMVMEKAQKLNIDLNGEIPWDQLNPNQKRELEKIQTEAERDLNLIINQKNEPIISSVPRGLMV